MIRLVVCFFVVTLAGCVVETGQKDHDARIKREEESERRFAITETRQYPVRVVTIVDRELGKEYVYVDTGTDAPRTFLSTRDVPKVVPDAVPDAEVTSFSKYPGEDDE